VTSDYLGGSRCVSQLAKANSWRKKGALTVTFNTDSETYFSDVVYYLAYNLAIGVGLGVGLACGVAALAIAIKSIIKYRIMQGGNNPQ